MHTPDIRNSDPQNQHGTVADRLQRASPGYEKSDVRVGGIVVFLIALFMFVRRLLRLLLRHRQGDQQRLMQGRRAEQQVEPVSTRRQCRGKNLESNAALEQKNLADDAAVSRRRAPDG